ncbi:MAG: hypothetical protein H7A12_10000 [Pseudomonadales bacterium]|jgi:hypothetical protein|nr:hypothetical protein [Pseudomonadales bacterium]MCP5337253.1 hypothetical protein [Pseudomonadales bacterium]
MKKEEKEMVVTEPVHGCGKTAFVVQTQQLAVCSRMGICCAPAGVIPLHRWWTICAALRCRDLAGWLQHRIQAAYPQLAGGVLVPMETVPILRRAMEEEADQVSDSCVIR